MADNGTIIVTGGAGFNGSAVVRQLIRDTRLKVINADKCTYAANLESVAEVAEAFHVEVDLRCSSPTFGHWVGEYLSAEDKRMLWMPLGFAHGFYALSASAEFQYKCTDFYAPEHGRSQAWDEPALGIAWPLEAGGPPTLSDKDCQEAPLSEAGTCT